MKKLILFLLLIFSSLCFSQKKEKIKGDKNVIHKSVDLKNFNSIVVRDGLEIILSTQNNTNSYSINADSNLHDIIKFEINDSILIIKSNHRISSKRKLEITLNAKEIKKITMYDDSELNQLGLLETESFEFESHGETKTKLDVKAKYIKTVMSESADADFHFKADTIRMILSDKIDAKGIIKSNYLDLGMYKDAKATLEGHCENTKINMAGKPNLKAKELTTENTNIRESNTSVAKINCSQNLRIFLEDNSLIYIYNTPNVVIEGIRDNAEIIKRNK